MTLANILWIAFVAVLVIAIGKFFDHLRRKMDANDRERREMRRAAERNS